MFTRNALCRGIAAALLISASAGVSAAMTTYTYTITGDVELGSETLPNAFNLAAGDTVTAYGAFTVDDGTATSGGIVSFEAGSGNTMTIDLNGTLLSALDDADYAVGGAVSPTLAFTSGWTLHDFTYNKESASVFYSSSVYFDDTVALVGQWRTDASVAVVPEAETYALMLAGLGLVGFMARRRGSRTA
jgi:hypothetical protein